MWLLSFSNKEKLVFPGVGTTVFGLESLNVCCSFIGFRKIEFAVGFLVGELELMGFGESVCFGCIFASKIVDLRFKSSLGTGLLSGDALYWVLVEVIFFNYSG